jgi:hypothetical protein
VTASLPKRDPDRRNCCASRAIFAVLLFAGPVALLVLTLPTSGQTTAGDRIYYSKDKSFKIPFEPEGGDRRIQKVELYVSKDGGRSWSQAMTRHPKEGHFPFQTVEDGWYWFAVRTIDQDNRAYPARTDQFQPARKVCVDSVPPEVTLRPLSARDGKVGVDWVIRDDNLDLNTLRLECRATGGTWQEIAVQKAQTGERVWNAPASGGLEVRLSVYDRAGNVGEKVLTLASGGGNSERYNPDPRPGSSDPGSGTGAGLSSIRYVNTTRISFNCKIEEVGTSGVGAVELWYTEDEGRSWRKYQDSLGKEPPFVVSMPEGDKLYGFTLIARSGVGKGEQPPQKGDRPQVYVQIDTTKPDVRLDGAKVGSSADGNTLTINWTARDQNMRPQPMTISYCERAGGDWKPIARDLDNSGRYVWKLPADVPPRMFVRVEAVDRAGNIGVAETSEEVIVDLKVPRVINIGVEGSK